MAGYFELLKASLKSPLQISTPFASSSTVGERFARHLHLSDDLHKSLSKKFPELEIHHASADRLQEIMGSRKIGAVISMLHVLWTPAVREFRAQR